MSAPPGDAFGPDDVSILSTEGVDHGRPVVWTAYQNGIPATGGASSTGVTKSTVAGYDAKSGDLIKKIRVTGKADGLRADPQHHRLAVTVNEDANSALNIINVESGSVTRFTYSPNPESAAGNGGTDSVAFWHNQMFIAHSNPDATTRTAVYEVSLDWGSHTATLTALFHDDSDARDAVTGASSDLALTDPDTDAVVPFAAPRFGGQLVLVSQGDGEMVFASRTSHPSLTVLKLSDKPTSAFPDGEPLPPIDGVAFATSDSGTLYVVDNKGGSGSLGTITALHTDGWGKGTVFVTEASDTGNPLLGVLNLSTGTITPLDNKFVNPKEVLFVPSD